MSDTLQIADQSVLLCKLMCYKNVYNKEVLRHDECKNNWNNWQNKVQFPFFPFFSRNAHKSNSRDLVY